jgi:hypothetical protein
MIEYRYYLLWDIAVYGASLLDHWDQRDIFAVGPGLSTSSPLWQDERFVVLEGQF